MSHCPRCGSQVGNAAAALSHWRKSRLFPPDGTFAFSLVQKGNTVSTFKGYMFVDTVVEEEGQPTIVSGMAITNNAGSFEFYELTLFPTKRLLEIHNPPEQANCKYRG